MSLPVDQPLPFQIDEHGVARMHGSRVTLDVILGCHLAGHTAESIIDDFDTVAPADVYGALAYYCRHTAEVEEYLEVGREAWRELKARADADPRTQQLREKMQAYRDQNAALFG